MSHDSHHLVMGELTDFLTGEKRLDTHDERYRQKLARYLVNDLGWDKSDIEANRKVPVRTREKAATLRVDFLVCYRGRAVIMVKYGPGSLVTRRLSNLALSRIIFPVHIPVVVTTNGEDAEVISGESGKVLGSGFSAIPGPGDTLVRSLAGAPAPVGRAMAEKAARIAFACEVDGSCAVDNDFKCDNFYCYPNPEKKS